MEFTQEVPAAAPQPKNNQRLTLSMQPAYFSQIVQEYWLGISLKFVVKNNDFILLYYTYRHAAAAVGNREGVRGGARGAIAPPIFHNWLNKPGSEFFFKINYLRLAAPISKSYRPPW